MSESQVPATPPHEHVEVAVEGASSSGVERVPARPVGDGAWQLLRSPLYAMHLAAGDTIRPRADPPGAFDMVARGGNVAVQFYLPEADLDDAEATQAAVVDLSPKVARLQGRLDGSTLGLMVFTIPLKDGFEAMEDLFEAAVAAWPGSQWQYANVYDPLTGEPLAWWES